MTNLTKLAFWLQNIDDLIPFIMVNKMTGLATAAALALSAGAAKADNLRDQFEHKYGAAFQSMGLTTDQMLVSSLV